MMARGGAPEERGLVTAATVRVDAGDWQGPLRRIWASLGYDEINWSYTPRGKALYRVLREVAEVPFAIRNHNALTSGNALSEPARGSTNVYWEDVEGRPRYDFTILDRLYDVIVGAGFYPLVELGFMPRALVGGDLPASSWLRDVGRESYEVDGLWKRPPRDYGRWADLCEAVVRHAVERYGRAEVEAWRFEVWNEPNLPNYWAGTLEEYCRLYDHAVAGVTRALPTARVGGPATSSPGVPEYRAFLRGFLAHVTGGRNTVTGATGTRIDFVSFHTKGAHYRRRRVYDPGVPVERESPSSAVMVGDIRAGLRTLAEFPALAGRPVLVDECDPAVGTIYGVHDNPSFVVTLTEHYPTFLCALVKRVLDLGRGFGDPIELITTWAFYLEGKRFFEGNRALVTNENIELPILNAFRMLARLGDTRLAVSSTHAREARLDDATVDPPAREVDALATLAGRRLAVLLWHQADAWWAEGRAEVTLVLERLPFTGPAVVRHFRIDGRHSNAYAEWVRMGRPDDPSPAQLARLRLRQGLEELAAPGRAEVDPGGDLRLAVTLPIQGTSLLEVEPAPAAEPGRAPTRRPKPGTCPRPGRGGPGSRPATSRGGRAR